MDLDTMHGVVLKHDGRIGQLERDQGILFKDARSLRRWLGEQFGELRRELRELGRARDDDTTDVRMLKVAVRRDERRRARFAKVAIGVASPLIVELARHLLHW